ncbi:MAG: hypothetical protein MUC95_08220 [Spirochaetes bacterium]|nr:hypothetical protein [Spirochaetota bacterium]
MAQEAMAREIPKATFMDYFGTYGGMAVKAFIFFVILGFITSPLWRSIYSTSNFWNYPKVGLYIALAIIVFLLLLGVVTAIFSKIFSIFRPKN